MDFIKMSKLNLFKLIGMLSQVRYCGPLLLALMALLLAPSIVNGKQYSVPSDPSEFQQQPENITLPVGHRVIMKCKLSSPVQRCRWYFLEKGLDFFDGRFQPVMVTDFEPKISNDCSIKFNKVREEQEGQWVCQGLQFHTTRYIISRPAVLTVITEEEMVSYEDNIDNDDNLSGVEDNSQDDDDDDYRDTVNSDGVIRQTTEEPKFELSEENFIHTTALGQQAVLQCKVNKALDTCSWVMPHGNVFHYTPYDSSSNSLLHNKNYLIRGNMTIGNCSLVVHNVRIQDEGNWRCVVHLARLPTNINEDDGEVLQSMTGPRIHLHVLEFSHSSESGVPLIAPQYDNATLIITLVLTSIVLLVVVLLLFCCLYRRINANNDEKQNILHVTNSSSNDSLKWMPKLNLGKDPHLIEELTSKGIPIQYTDLNHYNQYLDMSVTDSTPDGYIIMPGKSIRSSTSSRTTLSTLALGRSRTVSSATTSSNVSSSNGSQNSTFDNPSYMPEQTLERPMSLYSTGHLYEEIQEKEQSCNTEKGAEPTTPVYINLNEDNDGYMIPSKAASFEALVDLKSEMKPKVPSNIDSSKINNISKPPAVPTLDTLPKSPPNTITKLQSESDINIKTNSKLFSKLTKAPAYSKLGEIPKTTTVVMSSEIMAVNPEYVFRTTTPTLNNPLECYDIPRSTPIPSMLERQKQELTQCYDVPRNTAVTSIVASDSKVEVSLGGLSGTIV